MSKQRKAIIYIILLVALMMGLLCYVIGQIYTYITTDPIKVEVINYVLENMDTPEFEEYKTGYPIYYDSTGYWDASVEYGFYYEQNYGSHTGVPYGNGFRYDYGVDPSDWYYEEQICEQWWYYELHEG